MHSPPPKHSTIRNRSTKQHGLVKSYPSNLEIEKQFNMMYGLVCALV